MIRVAVFDRHPAVRAGVDALLDSQPGFAAMGCAGHRRELIPLIYRADPDVLLLDEPSLVPLVKVEAPRTRVLLYVADPAPELLLAAAVVGADGVVDKAADTSELLRALSGEHALPTVGLHERTRVAARLDPHDRPIFAMRLAGTSQREIANAAGITVAALNARVQAIVGSLTARAAA